MFDKVLNATVRDALQNTVHDYQYLLSNINSKKAFYAKKLLNPLKNVYVTELYFNIFLSENALNIVYHYQPKLSLKVRSCKLYNNKYMIASTQNTISEIFTFIAALVFKFFSRKVLFINRKDNRKCEEVGYFLKNSKFLR